MKHFIVIESWVKAVGLILPRKLKRYGHSYTFITRNPEHYNNWAGKKGLLSEGEFGGKHPILGMAKEVLCVETNDVPELVRFLRGYQEEKEIHGVLTCCDYYLETVAEVARNLGLPGPPPGSVKIASQKHLMRQAIRKSGLQSPNFVVTAKKQEALEFAQERGYPVVVKAVDLCSSEHVFAVHDSEELEQAFDKITKEEINIREQERPGQVLVEELLRGEEFSVETISFEGETSIVGITDKSLMGYPNFIESGVMHPAALEPEKQQILGQFVRDALKAIDYTHGLTHTEVKLTAEGPRIVEINARMGGSYLFELIEMVTGIDNFKVLIDLAQGVRPEIEKKTTSVQSAALRFILPPHGGVIKEVRNLDELRLDPQIHRIVIDDLIGQKVRSPESNDDFMGHIIAVDPHGLGARKKAEWAHSQVEIVVESVETNTEK